MKQYSLILLLFASVGLFAQTSSGGTSGVRIGNTGGPRVFVPTITFSTTQNNVSISSAEDKIKSFEIYDENYSLVGSTTFSPTSDFNASLNGLPAGMYTIYVVSEGNEERVHTIFKP